MKQMKRENKINRKIYINKENEAHVDAFFFLNEFWSCNTLTLDFMLRDTNLGVISKLYDYSLQSLRLFSLISSCSVYQVLRPVFARSNININIHL